MLDKPQQLSFICDAKTIRDIGMAYRAQTPAESQSGSLTDLLSEDSTGHAVSSNSDDSFIQKLINQKINHDFEKGHTVWSACFTTAGAPNPTLTLIALTLRLSDHIRSLVKIKSGTVA